MAVCAPDKVNDVIAEIDKMFVAFAESGPTEEELANAKKQIANRLDTQLREPSFWVTQLATLDLHKLKLDNLKNIAPAYNAISAEQVQAVFKKYCVPPRRIDIWAVPVEPPDAKAGEKPQGAGAEQSKEPAEKKPAAPAGK
jgi:predicted Zn-dependent peptidase